MRYSRIIRDAAAESIAEPVPTMPSDSQTLLNLRAAAQACFLTIDTAETLVKRRRLPFRRSGRLVFVAVGDLLAAARR